MKQLLLSVCTLPVLLLSPRLPAGEIQPHEGDNFGLEINEGAPVNLADKAGAFRVQQGPRFHMGGGVTGAETWADLPGADLSAEGIRLEWSESGWTSQRLTLPEPVAFAAVVSDGEGLLVIGGLREEGFSARVSRWNEVDKKWVASELPPLPLPLALCGAQVMDGMLYVAGGTGPGGDNAQLLQLDLAGGGEWSSSAMPETRLPLLNPLLEVRRDEKAVENALIITGGWSLAGNGPEGWIPSAKTLKFRRTNGFTPMRDTPEGYFLYASTPVGPSHIITAVVRAEEVPALPALVPRRQFPPDGFLRYHLFTDTWTAFTGGMGRPLTHVGWMERKSILLALADPANGETLYEADIVATERHFSFLDYAVMGLYMLGLVAIGKYFASRERSTEDFFLGGRKVPWWAAGLSIYATGTSAISFMAIPAKTYSTDWLYFIGMSIFPFFTVTIAAFVFIPMLRKLEITTVMEYFELRFGRPIRLLMSAITVLGQVGGRMSITLLLPSIALTAVTGMNIYACILTMGVLATIYTAVGGINAVIWTDVLQVFVLFGGALLSISLILLKLDGGFTSMITLAVADDKFNFFDFRWDFTIATMWVMVLWAVSDVFGKGLGQEGLQRAFSTKGVKEARWSMITCAVVALPAGFLFYGIGTALYSFYHANPDMLNPTLQTDAIFPLFIAQQLPAGIAGLVISGLFAASMSTLDTAMNTCATITVRDFYSIWRKDKGDKEQLVVAKLVTVFCGVFGTGIALYMASFENLGSLWDMFSILLGVIGGGLGGVGFLALCTTRATTYGTLAGAFVTAMSMVLIQRYTPVHFFIYGTISMAIGSTTGYLFSLVIPERNPKDLTGLTLWTAYRNRP